MSARALRKVLKQQESINNQNTDLSATDESESSAPNSPPPSSNPFDLLNDQEQEQENESSDVETSSTVKKDDVKKNTATNVSSSNKKQKKKKKKKNKVKELSTNTDDVNSLDLILKDLSVGVDSFGGQHQPSKSQPENVNGTGKRCTTNILQADPKFLSADNELRRIFGSRVVNSFEKSNQAGGSRQRRPGRRAMHSYKKTIIISPSEHWPRWDGSLSMELLENKNGFSYFRYVHSSTYSLAQRQFEAAKSAHDLNTIATILLHHPYHIDSLITLAEYFKFSGELQMSADATAKALYALECAWHPLFTPLQGNCQLKYEHDANKPLFTTLFAHMKNMDRRGCHRSALEVCKLLISLDSDDPVGTLFCIDYFSLRAEEYKWLERFSEEYKSDNSMWLYPNFSYSLAICRFYLEREESSKETEAKATSNELMKQALMLHPAVVRKLVVKVPLKEQVWSKIVNHSFFGEDETGSATLDHLINIYVEKSYIIWRLPEVHNFLKDTALSIIEKMEMNQDEARDWACVRKEAFASEKNEYSHLMVSDFSDSSPTIPPENLQNFMFDPRLVEMHNNNVNHNQENGAGAGVLHHGGEVALRNALATLVETMLPWIDYATQEGDGMPQDDED